jgi:hypothetical protein
MAMNQAGKLVLGIALAVVLGIVFLQPVLTAVDTSTGTQTETENVTAEFGSYSDLAGYELVDGSVTVTNASGTTLTEGTDYELRLGQGSVKALDTASVSAGETLTVSYDYQATGSMTSTVIGFVPVMFGVLLLVVTSRGMQRRM